MYENKIKAMTSIKNKRLQLRLTDRQKNLITRAAEVKQTTMTNFILEKSYEAALEVLTEQAMFSLEDQEWEAFCEALSAPPKSIPVLKKLLTEKSIFDEA